MASAQVDGGMERGWRCRSCGQVLGVTVGRVLVLSLQVQVDKQVRVQCRACGAWQTWYPPGGEGEVGMLFTVG